MTERRFSKLGSCRNPQELEHLWVLAGVGAGLIGYVGNNRTTSA